jgi:hypothetical protein
VDDAIGSWDDCAFDAMLKFANVSGPPRTAKGIDYLLWDGLHVLDQDSRSLRQTVQGYTSEVTNHLRSSRKRRRNNAEKNRETAGIRRLLSPHLAFALYKRSID